LYQRSGHSLYGVVDHAGGDRREHCNINAELSGLQRSGFVPLAVLVDPDNRASQNPVCQNHAVKRPICALSGRIMLVIPTLIWPNHEPLTTKLRTSQTTNNTAPETRNLVSIEIPFDRVLRLSYFSGHSILILA
jgi:hypothetical protein